MAEWLDAGLEVMMKTMGLVMYLAPVGLACYFADTVATVGGQLLEGYLRTFISCLVLTVISFVGLSSAYVFMAKGTAGLKAFWSNILTPATLLNATSNIVGAVVVDSLESRRDRRHQDLNG